MNAEKRRRQIKPLWVDASCIELDDDIAIAEPVNVCITRAQQTKRF
jgi:hypothetical protein